MTVQKLVHPLGIQSTKPEFGYELSCERTGAYQEAVRILAATSPERLQEGAADLWDSGKISQKECFGIRYQGKTLQSRQLVYWKVKVWDEKGDESPWSEVSFFETGLLKEEDWSAKWIGQGDAYCGDHSVSPLFVRDFTGKNKAIRKARIYISGLGMFRLSVNGDTVEDTFFDPGESSGGKTVYYVTYDVTNLIRKGENTVGVELGNGQYCGFLINPVMTGAEGNELPAHRYQKNDGVVYARGIQGKKKLIFQLEITYEDETCQRVISDEEWKWIDGPTIFQNWYGGEDYDATLEIPAWNKPGTNRDGWKNGQIMEPPGGRLIGREFEPIRIMERFFAASVRALSNGNYLVDMGRNGAGVVCMYLKGTTVAQRGKWIRMYPAEICKEDGSGVDQSSCTQSWNERYHCVIMNSYRIKGTGEESWNASFCYQGFRYVEIEGFPGIPGREDFEYCILRAANKKNGSFSSSSVILNAINDMTERSMESNMFGAFTDCPQIEKLGWIETSHLMFRSLAGTYDIRSWMRKIIHDITDAIVDPDEAGIPGNEPKGYVPAIIPEFQRITGLHIDPNWNGACIFTPWEYYLYYGEISILEKNYPVMKKYMSYLYGHVTGGCLDEYAQMGEWGEYGEHTPTVLVATAALYRMECILAQVAETLHAPIEADEWRYNAYQTKLAFHAHPECYDPVTGRYGSGSQASYGCALYAGLVSEEKKKEAVEHLVEVIKNNGYHLSSGEVGLKQVFCALGENGRNDVVYKMIMNPTAPSYRFFADRGLTTLPEYWNYDELWHGMSRSRNHAMMGHVKEWIMYYLLGIRQLTPGFKEIRICPFLPEDIDEMHGSIGTPFGRIQVSVYRKNGKIKTEYRLPPGVHLAV
ncbi:MAG: glycoside hydrolase family 78 protein [Lachnospiraceae bacterium]|nr:glycoside hydrolase family 78 protein [Lachnospiraceae bacterium]